MVLLLDVENKAVIRKLGRDVNRTIEVKLEDHLVSGVRGTLPREVQDFKIKVWLCEMVIIIWFDICIDYSSVDL